MKILHVESGMHLYGGALQVVFLMRGLKALGVHSVLACPEGSAIAQAAQPHAQVVAMPMKGDADIGLVNRLRRLIREQRPNLIHLHSRRGADIWGAIAGRLEGVPVVLSRRVDNPEPSWVAKLKYRLHHRVVTISDGIRQVLLSEGVPAQKIRCVLSAVDTSQYHPASEHRAWFQSEFSLPQGSTVVGMIAQFIPRKGHHVLLDALPAALTAHPATRVILFGQGPELGAVRERIGADPLLRQHVQLAGFRSDLDRILPCLDIVAHPAMMEGLGVSLLQAAACGIPLIGARAGGIPEIVRDGLNGELVPPGDAPALAAALSRLLEDPERRARFGQAGRDLAVREFSIEAMVKGNLGVYRELTGQ